MPSMVFFSFLSWFRPWWKTSETDYESVLNRLSKDINSVQSRLVKINQRERRASVTLPFYAVLIWLLYVIGVWFWTAESRLRMTKTERFSLWSPAAFGFLFIISTRILVRWWYRKIAEGEETHLRSLQRTRRKKIDEIKLATKYDHLRSLLEKYDDTASRSPEDAKSIKQRSSTKTINANGHAPSSTAAGPVTPKQVSRRSSSLVDGGKGPTPARIDVTAASSTAGKDRQLLSPTIDGRQIQPAIPSQKIQTTTQIQRTWLDRVADKVLGAEAGGQELKAEQRYALICRICFTHNGLCPKEEWEEVQYICPRCGTFNSRRPSTAPVSSPWGKKEPLPSDHGSTASRPVSPSPTASLRSSSQFDRKSSEEMGSHDRHLSQSKDEEEEEEEILKDKEETRSKVRNRRRTGRFAVDNDSNEGMEID